MRPFSRIPIRRKLRLVILGTCTAALCVASAALFGLQFYFFQRDYKDDLHAVGEIVGHAATTSLMSGSKAGAQGILDALNAKPHIIGAVIEMADGRLESQFGRWDAQVLNKTLEDGFQTPKHDLVYVHPLLVGGARLGTLYLVSDFQAASLRLQVRYASILIAVLGISFLVAVLVCSRLERFIADPIHRLAETAKRIAARNDYSLRAIKSADDELGDFTDSFNRMLTNIQNRDSALRYEIAERARAEQELQRAQEQLMDASRQEGAADVATCVLHNVGNVLNSVNVSASVITETLGLSRTDNLVKASQLLREHQHSLETFLREDPKGLLLPDYFADACEHLVQERTTALSELELLHKNIDHIKEIVAMQQSYARSSGLIQKLAVAELVEDALRMNDSALQRHGVVVIRNFEPVPMVALDKHKVLQVLVNLLRNARYALDDAAPQKKRLTVSVRQPPNEPFIEISVDDNGIGISEKHLTKIFSHGFTTRKDGHGFGLHSGALAAQKMGGRLSVQSAGHMRGATFTLRLPLVAPK